MNTTETTFQAGESEPDLRPGVDASELLPGLDETGEQDSGLGEMPSSEELNNNEAAHAAAAAARAAIGEKASASAQKIAAQREQAKAEKAAKAAAEKAEKAAKAAAEKAEKAAKAAAAKAEKEAKAAAEKEAREAKAAAAKAEKEAKAAAAKEAKEAAEKAEKEAAQQPAKVLLDNHMSLLADTLCPYCRSSDITLDDEQGAKDEGKYYYCHACDTSYDCADGSLRPPSEVVVEHTVDPIRSVAASKSWDDASIREARSQRHGCNVLAPDGTTSMHPSVYKAFVALGLPVAKHQKFRKELKAASILKFGDYTFTVI